MAWNLPRDGGGFNAGFDTGGPERVWQAGQTGELADLANKPQYADFYNNLLNEYGATKEDVVTGGTWMNPEGTVVEEEERDHRMGIEPPPYPSKWNPFTWFNQGGIASLENRPGYAWGGYEPGETYSYHDLGGNRMLKSEITRKHPMARDNPLIQDVGGHDIGSAVRDRDLFTQIGRSENYQWDPKKEDEYGFSTNPLYGDQEYIKDEYKINPYFGMFDERFKVRDFPWMNDGGAVGLEPGIGSLMGYAKGGMVTKVRVPKGQSKWMKRFVNNMRDS